jgi:hypothetical protein
MNHQFRVNIFFSGLYRLNLLNGVATHMIAEYDEIFVNKVLLPTSLKSLYKPLQSKLPLDYYLGLLAAKAGTKAV